MAVLGFCFSAGVVFQPPYFALTLALTLITVGVGFIGHEVAHKFVAQRFGYLAVFRLWVLGLIFALLSAVITGGRIIFAMPGQSTFSR